MRRRHFWAGIENEPAPTMTWVGFGGRKVTHYGPTFELGQGIPRGIPDTGIRRVFFDIAFGYVSGFPIRDIVYYLLTRTLSARIRERIIAAEMKRDGIVVEQVADE